MERNSMLEEELTRVLRCLELKDLRRTGWVLRGVADPESVADHSWGTAFLCMVFAAPGDSRVLDSGRAVAMAIIHDLAEVEVGDIPRRVKPGAVHPGAAEKSTLERAAIGNLLEGSGQAGHLTALWEEYERGESEEARFVRDMNLLDMCLQAVLYERDRRYDDSTGMEAGGENFPDFPRLDEFFETSRNRFTTATGKKAFKIAEEIYKRYRA